LHLEIIPGAVERNQFIIVEAIKQAAFRGADWIVTPELAVCGLQFPRLIGLEWIQPQPDQWMQRVCGLMKDLKRTLFIACPERDGGRFYNSVFIIDSQGEIIGKRRKINVVSDSSSWSSPGDDVTPIECDGIKVGVLVCSDAYTMNIARALRFSGAQMLVAPTSWGPGIHGPNGEWEDRTRETGLPLIVANRTGTETALDFWKAPSLVVNNGEQVLSHTSDRSAILRFDWNFSRMVPLSTDFHREYVNA
jgi:N-carbamoylputrescine amidase